MLPPHSELLTTQQAPNPWAQLPGESAVRELYNLGPRPDILPDMEPPLELHSDPEIQRPVSPEVAVHPSLGNVTMENKLTNIVAQYLLQVGASNTLL